MGAVQGTMSIGVSQLSPKEFLEDLKLLISEDPVSFQTKPILWHTQLAESLYKLTADDKLLSLKQEIFLIPLEDGTWTSAKEKSMFFAKGESSLEFPSGIDVLIVNKIAEADVNRRRFLVSLGVKDWQAPEICRLILQVHESSDFDAKSLTPDQLVSHAKFLYNSSWQPPKDVNIWFATMQDERCLGRKLYIAGSIAPDSAASRVFAKLQERFPVIHNGYLDAFPSDVKWPHWLVKNLGLSMVPRLITPLIEPKLQAVLKTRIQDTSPTSRGKTFLTRPGETQAHYQTQSTPPTQSIPLQQPAQSGQQRKWQSQIIAQADAQTQARAEAMIQAKSQHMRGMHPGLGLYAHC
jgi:hypothetical protein